MFYKSTFYILLGLLIFLTAYICTTKPKMHTTLLVYDSAYELAENTETKAEKKTVAQSTVTVKTPQVERKIESIPTTTTKQVKKQQTVVPKVATTTPQAVKTVSKSTTKVQSQPQKKIETKTQPQTKVIVQPKPQSKPQQTVQQVTQKVQPKPVQQAITPQQEEIEWNKWRSNIQNQIMRDVKLPILPQGTAFKFSFEVDKFGRVSNVQTWSLTPSYTPYAIQYIAPVIRSYQGRSILDFPQGTNRVMTTVTGQWKISTTKAKYSTSSNFHDIETVRKGN